MIHNNWTYNKIKYKIKKEYNNKIQYLITSFFIIFCLLIYKEKLEERHPI